MKHTHINSSEARTRVYPKALQNLLSNHFLGVFSLSFQHVFRLFHHTLAPDIKTLGKHPQKTPTPAALASQAGPLEDNGFGQRRDFNIAFFVCFF